MHCAGIAWYKLVRFGLVRAAILVYEGHEDGIDDSVVVISEGVLVAGFTDMDIEV